MKGVRISLQFFHKSRIFIFGNVAAQRTRYGAILKYGLWYQRVKIDRNDIINWLPVDTEDKLCGNRVEISDSLFPRDIRRNTHRKWSSQHRWLLPSFPYLKMKSTEIVKITPFSRPYSLHTLTFEYRALILSRNRTTIESDACIYNQNFCYYFKMKDLFSLRTKILNVDYLSKSFSTFKINKDFQLKY